MTEVSNTNNTVNINLEATLGISDTEAANLVQKLNNEVVGKDGITGVSYVNGQLEVKGTGITVDILAAKLQQLAFSSDEMKAIFGEDIKDVTFKQNDDGTITLTTNGVSNTKKITDFDIRELMKLLISAFSELMTADRERALNVLNATVAALETKISQMETAAQEQYKAAMTQAIGSIAAGVTSVTMAGVSGGCLIKGTRNQRSGKTMDFKTDNKDAKLEGIDITKAPSSQWSNVGQMLSNMSLPLGKIIEGGTGIAAAGHSLAKSEADIESAKADALLEILRTAQEQYRKGSDSLQQFVDKVLNIMMQLLQSASQTEKAVANI